MTILLADIHAFLDNLKAPIEIVEQRAEYYRFTITAMLKAVNVPTDKLRFVLGSSYQKTPEYVMDVYRMASVVSENDARRAGSETVKQSANPPLSGLLYPVLQILDEQYLDVDAQFGGMDQRKLFTAAKEWLPKLGYRERAHLINPLVPGLQGAKMSSSDPSTFYAAQARYVSGWMLSPLTKAKKKDSKIDLLDSAETIASKIRKAEAFPKVVEGNGVLAFTEYVLLPAAELKGNKEFVVERREGEPLVYTSIEQMQEDYRNDVVCTQSIPIRSTSLNLFLTNSLGSSRRKSSNLPSPRPSSTLQHLCGPLSKNPRPGRILRSRPTRRQRRRSRRSRTRAIGTRTALSLPLRESSLSMVPLLQLLRLQRRTKRRHRI